MRRKETDFGIEVMKRAILLTGFNNWGRTTHTDAAHSGDAQRRQSREAQIVSYLQSVYP